MMKILKTIAWIALFGLCIFISKVMFEAIYYSDMPMWMKYLMLG